jgi:hypothetical protein
MIPLGLQQASAHLNAMTSVFDASAQIANRLWLYVDKPVGYIIECMATCSVMMFYRLAPFGTVGLAKSEV